MHRHQNDRTTNGESRYADGVTLEPEAESHQTYGVAK